MMIDGVTCNNVKCRNISRGYLTYVPTEHGWCYLSLSKNWVVASTPPTTSDNDKWSSHYFPYATPHHHHLTWLQRSWWTPGYLTTRKKLKVYQNQASTKVCWCACMWLCYWLTYKSLWNTSTQYMEPWNI